MSTEPKAKDTITSLVKFPYLVIGWFPLGTMVIDKTTMTLNLNTTLKKGHNTPRSTSLKQTTIIMIQHCLSDHSARVCTGQVVDRLKTWKDN